jgi:hypothetical protein
MLPAVGLDADEPVHPHPSQQQAAYKVLHTTSCILRPNVPEDGHNYCPKNVEITLEFKKMPIVASN